MLNFQPPPFPYNGFVSGCFKSGLNGDLFYCQYVCVSVGCHCVLIQ